MAASSSSNLLKALAQLIISLTKLNSLNPNLLQLEMSILSTTSVCSPIVPLAWQFIDRAISLILSYPTDLRTFGKIMWTDPLKPVPKLLGQQLIIPKIGSLMNTSYIPFSFYKPCSRALTALPNLSKTLFTSPPYSIEMTLM